MSPEIGDCLYYACNTEFTALFCSFDLNEYKASGAVAVAEKLHQPKCLVDYWRQVYGSTAECEAFYGGCQQFQVGARQLNFNGGMHARHRTDPRGFTCACVAASCAGQGQLQVAANNVAASVASVEQQQPDALAKQAAGGGGPSGMRSRSR